MTSTHHHSTDDLNRLLNIQEIYFEPEVLAYPRAQAIFAQYPEASRIEVASHWQIPELNGNPDAVGDWNRIKQSVLVLGVKKSLQARPNCANVLDLCILYENGIVLSRFCSYGT